MGRIGILGCGSIGARHGENLRLLGEGDLIAHDPSPESRERFQAKTGLPVLPTLEAFWAAAPRIVVVATPTALHLPLAAEALRRGCALFVEKPLGDRREGLAALLAQAAAAGVTTMAACNMRFHPGPAALRAALASGAIGELLSLRLRTGSHLPDWRPWQDYRQSYSAQPGQGGIVLDGIHEIDLAHWLGGPARVVGAAARRAHSLGLEVEGLCEILLRHEGGPLSAVHLNFVQRGYRRGIEAVGAKGTLEWDFARPRVTCYDGAERVVAEWNADKPTNDMYLDEMRHFLSAVAAGTPTCCPLAEGAAVLDLALQARDWPGLLEGDRP